MAKKYCAHFNPARADMFHEQLDTIAEAIALLKTHARPESFAHDEGRPSVHVSDDCDDCTSARNFHGDFFVRYEVGPRGGITRTAS